MSVLLETERLLLRPLKAADISYCVPLLNDFEVSKNLSRVPYPYTEDDACAFIVRVAEGWRTGSDCPLAVLSKPGVFIGMCGIHPNQDWEVGYWLGRPFWGNGYATEACGRAIAWAFDEFKTEVLNAGWFHDNPASGRVLSKLGFRATGEEERSCVSRGGPVACHLVELDRATYMTRKMAP
jgi:[ribosomal protein S5]-alanine N-acetyltransferase